jgi:hypothetical protein
MTPGGDPDDPDDEADAPPPRPLLGPGFWAILVVSLTLVLAGLAVALLAPGP